jgi:hypothetical protein
MQSDNIFNFLFRIELLSKFLPPSTGSKFERIVIWIFASSLLRLTKPKFRRDDNTRGGDICTSIPTLHPQ